MNAGRTGSSETVYFELADLRCHNPTIPQGDFRFGSILLQKSFWGYERKFSGTLTRAARGDLRDHVVPRKNDHGPA
jgi:hypothetical protein